MSSSPTSTFLTDLAPALATAGFDLVAATTLASYEARVPPDFLLKTGLSPDSMVVLIGNDRRAWPHFRAWLDAEPTRRAIAHPFDRWTLETLQATLRPVLAAHDLAARAELRFVFEGPPRQFAAQHLAEATGLACRGPAGLSVHPELGPWFALRAALVVALTCDPAPPPRDLCGACEGQPCRAALDRALTGTRQDGARPDHRELREAWRPWLAIREACPVGREHRYSEAQIRWHYAHDREALR